MIKHAPKQVQNIFHWANATQISDDLLQQTIQRHAPGEKKCMTENFLHTTIYLTAFLYN